MAVEDSPAHFAEHVIDFFRPKPSPFPLVRIGGEGDGAYLVPDVLQSVVACFSPGVSNRKEFEDELLLRAGIPSHMMDFSSDASLFRTPLVEGSQTFLKKWLSPTPGPDNVSLSDWVARMGGDKRNFLLQMDIEGAEYANLIATPKDVLERFLVLVVEFHGLCTDLVEENFPDTGLAATIERLSGSFVSVHARANNCRPSRRFGRGIVVPDVLEVTFLRADYHREGLLRGSNPPLLPNPLDIRRNCIGAPPAFLGGQWRSSALGYKEIEKIVSDSSSYYLYLAGQKFSPCLDEGFKRLSPNLRKWLGSLRRIGRPTSRNQS